MDAHTQALQAYIEEQRQGGFSDEVILQGLIANGWPAETVQQFLKTQPAPGNQPAAVNQRTGLFTGRIGRLGYLLGIVYFFAFLAIPLVLEMAVHSSKIINLLAILVGVAGVIILIPLMISLHIRRWHDLDQSGWLTLLGLVPVVGLITSVLLLVLPGTSGNNNYATPYDGRLTPLDIIGFKKN